ncbi:Histidine kinase-, DNA gyrase B-, and HSP90-like ATPase [Palleronia marisminoris]|uniref:Osmolarity sensor protein n=1 Tax=Palleronia marisminoris TaxID=315423 RepID=A0A1Y5TYC4_9RHOB|nr:ATP-binding protein [Palleronia marisminoris]SFH55397.1 Histidine kinase-, DNA gyrase B-, and HSP90-like ATPase [Palleronia marisminoris]SLN71463.1 osmolarity sensor protein [Palleronia marisminoris]
MMRQEPQDHILHDLRNALTHIRLTAEALCGGKDAATRRGAERILRTVDHSTTICESQLRDRADERKPAETDAAAVAAEVAQELADQGSGKVRIFLDIPGRKTLRVRCGPQALRAIIANLVDNAKAALAAHADPVIRLRLGAEGDFVVIDVSDNGGGFPEGGRGCGSATGPRIGPDGYVRGVGARSSAMLSCMLGGRMIAVETGPEGMRMWVILPAASPQAVTIGQERAG